MPARQIEPVGGDEGGGIEEDIPARDRGPVDPFGGMLHTREVGLRGIGEQVVATGPRRLEKRIQGGVRDPHPAVEWDVGGRRAPHSIVFADPVDRVVVVEGEQQLIATLERIGLTHQFQGLAGVRREDDVVLLLRCAKVLEDPAAGLAHHVGRGHRRRVHRVGIAEHPISQPAHVRPDQRVRIQPPTGVVQVDVTFAIEPCEVIRPELVENASFSEGRKRLLEGCLRLSDRRCRAHLSLQANDPKGPVQPVIARVKDRPLPSKYPIRWVDLPSTGQPAQEYNRAPIDTARHAGRNRLR